MLLLVAPSLAFAGFIDFEAFADTQNINGMNLGGVTITNPTNNIVEIYDDRFGVAYHSATKAIASLSGAASVNPMVFTFDMAQTMVSLWAGDEGNDTDNWTLNAYNAPVGGALVATANSGNWNGFPYTQLVVNAPAIWRVEAIWNGPACCGVGYDDLQFEGVPEPATLALLGLGLVGLGFRSRRRRG
jgi:hypothetical protein